MQDIEIQAQHGAETVEDVPLDVAHLFSGRLRNALDNVPQDMHLLNEVELDRRVRPTQVDWDLRIRFSQKVKEAVALKKPSIPTARIYEDILARSYFEDVMLNNPLKVAWFSRPLVEYTALYEAINRTALTKILRTIQNMEGDLDPKMLGSFMKLAEQAGNRAYGAVAQKMQIQSRNLNIEGNVKDLPPPSDHGEMAKKIEAMHAKLLSEPKDVTPKED